LAAAILFVAIGLFVPWQNNHHQSEGYSLIFWPPSRATVDLGRLFIQWIMLIVVVASALFLTKGAETESRFRIAARSAAAFVGRNGTSLLLVAIPLVFGSCVLVIVVATRPDKYEAIELRKGMSEGEINSRLGEPDRYTTGVPGWEVVRDWGVPSDSSRGEWRVADYGAIGRPMRSGESEYRLTLLFRNGKLYRWKRQGKGIESFDF
jgi:hypothetical protein